ncbi:DUF3108 domain-containing protein [uncultured Polaribacter sp.]|uniref:DUF3108 domain-containing protein n=1 Tax=uncultured Polaribacter sp. TaxID=174711 RepID=UPI0030DAF4BD|tara:strand:- start:384 stop:1145 length:762 start_codon:yes stop_codon:yes gene_type:complete
MKKILLILVLFFLVTSFKSDTENPVKSGERLVYSGSYNMSGLLTQIAQVNMTTEKVTTAKNNYLHFSCSLATYSKWDSFFKIRDLYESYVNPISLKPSLYKRNINEGGFIKKEKYVIKGSKVNSTVSFKNNQETQNSFTIGTNTVDVITFLYQMRTVNFVNFKVGQTKSFTIVFDEKEMDISLKYMGKETINAGNLGKKECYKVSIAAKTAALKGKDKNIIWLTADEHKIPALIQFSIPVGVGNLTLKSATGI